MIQRTSARALALLALTGAALAAPRTPDGAAGDPNVLVILLDDVGPEQLQCYDPAFTGPGVEPGTNLYTASYPYAPTPNISALARDGVRFTNAFTSPICSPSRAMLMTGRYPFRNQVGGLVNAAGNARDLGATLARPLNGRIPQLPASEVVLPELVTALAPQYQLGMVGKWHLSAAPCVVDGNQGAIPMQPFSLLDIDGEDHPTTRGWPFFRGLLGNVINRPSPHTELCIPPSRPSYFDWFLVREPQGAETPGYLLCPPLNPGEPTCLNPFGTIPETTPYTLANSVMEFRRDEFLTTRLREEVQDFILTADATGDPWLAVWSPQACHGPFSWPPQSLHGYGGPPPLEYSWLRYRALLEAFDTELGKLRAALSAGPGPTIWERTVVILLSDNGTDQNVVLNAIDSDQGGVPGVIAPYVAPSDYIDPMTSQPALPTQPTRFKGSVHVSGTSMACIVSGPVVAGKGRVHGGLVDMVDVFSTVRELVGIGEDWPVAAGGPMPGYHVDGVSLCPILIDANDPPPVRTESLALNFSPNGPFDTSPTGDTLVVRAGYARQLPGGEIYHLLDQSWVKANGGLWDLVVNEPDELYQLTDASGANVDTQETVDVAATQPAILATLQAGLQALLASPDTFP